MAIDRILEAKGNIRHFTNDYGRLISTVRTFGMLIPWAEDTSRITHALNDLVSALVTLKEMPARLTFDYLLSKEKGEMFHSDIPGVEVRLQDLSPEDRHQVTEMAEFQFKRFVKAIRRASEQEGRENVIWPGGALLVSRYFSSVREDVDSGDAQRIQQAEQVITALENDFEYCFTPRRNASLEERLNDLWDMLPHELGKARTVFQSISAEQWSSLIPDYHTIPLRAEIIRFDEMVPRSKDV